MEISLLLSCVLLFAFGVLNYFFRKSNKQPSKTILLFKVAIWAFAGIWILMTPDARTNVMFAPYVIASYVLFRQVHQMLPNKQP